MDTTFRELAADPRVEAVPFAHMSLELGHLYMDDFKAGKDHLKAQLAKVVHWANAARAAISERTGPKTRPRVSTCFLIDDYFTQFSTPAAVLPDLLDAAASVKLEIDYLARESACAESNGIPLAEMVAGWLTTVPPEGFNGSRPPAVETGWVCNGERSPSESQEAMRRTDWAPPVETGARNHSVFADIELWRDRGKERQFSCAYLAAIWQLLRLGVLRYEGSTVVKPRQVKVTDFPQRWDELPPIVQLRDGADSFCGYRTFSVLPYRFLQVEHAVRVILSQISAPQEPIDQVVERGRRDGVPIPHDVTERIEYMFMSDW
ncbi:hypothetical protein DMH04_19815 [Kibdelosporangium aridum]|uniref:Uncharacterized protein n=2 Tax=Kibdelosporangium aridum TaxID=2030 RepID=A0A428Z9T5_KIBAR|nr:hypothetical protein DMH04_19815 [Kibdelosporangium aridum]